MTDLPSFAMRVSDVASSCSFLIEMLGFTLTEQRSDIDIAYLLDSDGDAILLAGPAAHDLSPYLSAQHYIVRPGEIIGMGGSDIETRLADLRDKGVKDVQIKQNRMGDRILVVPIFDNYVFQYHVPAEIAFEELLRIYSEGPAQLDEALAGLGEAEMDLTLNDENWSIRQIVHHLADSDLLWAQTMKIQLSNPGSIMVPPYPVGNENVSTGREYRERPVATSVALFRAFHSYIVDITRYIPNAGERAVKEGDEQGPTQTFHQVVHLITGHTDDHLEEIWAIRRAHGK